MGQLITADECERVQTNWFRSRAELLGGQTWRDGPLLWTDGPDGQNLMFPRELTSPGIRRGVERAQDLGYPLVGAWLSRDLDASLLADAGFERGWAPHWMSYDLHSTALTVDPRVVLQTDTDDYRDEYADYRAQLALARQVPTRAWYAAAYAGSPRRFAGRCWSFLDGEQAGIFDMSVWPPFRRQGLGTALLAAVCRAAAEAGAQQAVLNATPEGELLYRACGFTRVDEGITWWLHLR